MDLPLATAIRAGVLEKPGNGVDIGGGEREHVAFLHEDAGIARQGEHLTHSAMLQILLNRRQSSNKAYQDVSHHLIGPPPTKVISIKEHTSLLVLLPSFCVAMTVT